MSDPYQILGVKQSAGDDEIKRAYRDLVKKYHPDSYQNNPLSELAEEKMKEVNNAYDAIVKMRAGGGGSTYQSSSGSAYQSYGGGQSGHTNASSDPTLQMVRQQIQQGNFQEAQSLLERSSNHNAEWNYLMGTIAYRRGWLAEARDYFRMACSMEPANMEYRQAAQYLENQSNQGFQSYQRGGLSTSDCCMGAMCCHCLSGGCS